MVTNELVVVLPWLLEAKEKNEELLGPEGCLHKVVRLELGLHFPVRITYKMYPWSKDDYLAQIVDDLSSMPCSRTSTSVVVP